jgi:thiol-disulfide isomerase/thioredoxin
MKFINKSSVIGFLLGLVVSPALIIGGLYIYVKLQTPDMKEMAFSPPDVPGRQKVDLDWKVKALDGTEINLGKEIRDRVVFLNFWATWCPPCVGEMPSIEKLYRRFEGKIAFACVSNEDVATIKAFRNAQRYTFPMYHIEGDPPAGLRSEGIPATFIISRKGTMVLKHVGGADWAHETVVAFLEDLLSDKVEHL